MQNNSEHEFLESYLDLRPPRWLFSKHLETIIPSTLRKTPGQELIRERLELADGDFLDLDWCQNQNNKLVILSHGLEGSSRRPYMLGMIKELNKNGFDSLAWNCRSCSEDLNRLPRLYHHVDYEDLDKVINHAISRGYSKISLLGFSMGGNLSLHWLHKYPEKANKYVQGSVVISAPLDLKACAIHLMRPDNVLYKRRFLKKLKEKLLRKKKQFPDEFNLRPLSDIDSFYKLDEYYTAPIHGFKNAEDFYHKGSTYYKLKDIGVRTLIIQAQNDPFFPESCYPDAGEVNNPNLHFLYPRFGGHVGFTKKHNNSYYSEEIAVKFLKL